MKPLSIRWRMTLWNTVAFALVLLGFGFLVYGMLRQIHYEQVDRSLESRFRELAGDKRLAAAPNERFQFWMRRFGKHVEISGIVLDADGTPIAQAEQLTSLHDRLTAVDPPENSARFDSVTLPAVGHARRMTARLPVGAHEYTVVLLAELDHVDEEMQMVVRVLLITSPISLAVAAALAYVLARTALAPVEQLRRMTDEITAERLDRRLPVSNSADELGQLAQTINSMIGRLERSFGEIRRFTADASHELRTPIAVIRSEAELGIDPSADLADAQNRLGSILEECSRLTWTADQLLTLCREDAGLTQLTAGPVSLNALVSDVVEFMQPLAEGKEQSLSWAAAGAEAVVSGDADRLHRVFVNLIDNAVKYTPPGGTIGVRLDRSNGEAVVTVQDSGIGIAPEHLPRVFDRFYRVQHPDPQPPSGAGLGLSIAQSIVAAHGGRIEPASRLGEGSTFRVFLPLATGAATPGLCNKGRNPQDAPARNA